MEPCRRVDRRVDRRNAQLFESSVGWQRLAARRAATPVKTMDDDEVAFGISRHVARACWPRRRVFLDTVYCVPIVPLFDKASRRAASQWNRCATGSVAGSLADGAAGGELNSLGSPGEQTEGEARRGSSCAVDYQHRSTKQRQRRAGQGRANLANQSPSTQHPLPITHHPSPITSSSLSSRPAARGGGRPRAAHCLRVAGSNSNAEERTL